MTNFKAIKTENPAETMFEMVTEQWDEDQIQHWLENVTEIILAHMYVCSERVESLDDTDIALLTLSEAFLFLLGRDVYEENKPDKGEMH